MSLFPPLGRPALVMGDMNGDAAAGEMARILDKYGFHAALDEHKGVTALRADTQSSDRSCHPLDNVLFRAPLVHQPGAHGEDEGRSSSKTMNAAPARPASAALWEADEDDEVKIKAGSDGILDFGLFKAFPPARSDRCESALSADEKVYEAKRLKRHLRNVGSDHLPIIASFRVLDLKDLGYEGQE